MSILHHEANRALAKALAFKACGKEMCPATPAS